MRRAASPAASRAPPIAKAAAAENRPAFLATAPIGRVKKWLLASSLAIFPRFPIALNGHAGVSGKDIGPGGVGLGHIVAV
jgi:hypothetical protein